MQIRVVDSQEFSCWFGYTSISTKLYLLQAFMLQFPGACAPNHEPCLFPEEVTLSNLDSLGDVVVSACKGCETFIAVSVDKLHSAQQVVKDNTLQMTPVFFHLYTWTLIQTDSYFRLFAVRLLQFLVLYFVCSLSLFCFGGLPK